MVSVKKVGFAQQLGEKMAKCIVHATHGIVWKTEDEISARLVIV